MSAASAPVAAAAAANVNAATAEQQGRDLLTAALAFEAKGELDSAVQTYQLALRSLLDAVKFATSAQKKETLRNLVDRYMTRAERIKQQQLQPAGSAASSAAAASSPASAPSVSSTKRKTDRSHAVGAGAASGKTAPSRSANSAKPAAVAKSSRSKQETKSKEKESEGKEVADKIDPRLRAVIEGEILDGDTHVSFEDVVGMDSVKQALHEMVILPALRPDLFTGLRKPPRGLLLYGPPGNGKTFIAKAVASEARCTFFSISAATLVSRYLGEGEKLVRALFTVARERAPAIIFIDEIDSILGRRGGDAEHEASRRLKTEFLTQVDGVDPAGRDKHVVVIGATNLPESLDEAVIRRLPKRILVPSPSAETRQALIDRLLKGQRHNLSARELQQVVDLTDGYSASDLTAVCQDAAMGPLRDLGSADRVLAVDKERLAPITAAHFARALQAIKPSVSKERLKVYQTFEHEQQQQQKQ